MSNCRSFIAERSVAPTGTHDRTGVKSSSIGPSLVTFPQNSICNLEAFLYAPTNASPDHSFDYVAEWKAR